MPPIDPATKPARRARKCAVAVGTLGWIAAALLAACADGWSDAQAPAPSAVPIGATAVDTLVTDRRFLPRFLSELGPAPATVLVFTSAGCPLAARYLPRLAEMERELRPRDVRFVAVDVGHASIAEAMDQAFEFDFDFHVVKDPDGSTAAAVGATRSPQVVVLDGERRIVNRGRVDGQHRLAGTRPEPGRADLREALDDVLAGRPVRVPETAVDGCPLEVELITPDPELTWSANVEPLFARHCAPCHEPGAPGPFPLHTYDAVFRRKRVVAEVVQERRMPPWFALPGHGHFENERNLSPTERRTVLAWLAAGAPRGEVRPDAAVQPRGEWRMGTPDLIVDAPAFDVPASGAVEYVYHRLPYRFEQDTWIEAVEVLPSAASVVHHAQVMYIDESREYTHDTEWISWSRLVCVYVPGREVFETAPGTAFLVPAGSSLGLQMHYVPDGRSVAEKPRVGLRFPRSIVHKRLRSLWLADMDFEVPPGATAHTVVSTRGLKEPRAIEAHSILPHMHLRGRDLGLVAHYPDGRTESLLRVPNYNFDWQLDYRYAPGAKRFPPGTSFEFTARYDNSAFNALNPDPSATVRFGELTTDEMFYCWFFYTYVDENLELAVDPATGHSHFAPNERSTDVPRGIVRRAARPTDQE